MKLVFRSRPAALLLTLLALTLPPISSPAQRAPVPPLMNFQGRLARPDGVPVADGNYSVRFSLWTAQTGGTEKWNQTLSPVAVRNGVFAVLLNTSLGAADKFNGNLFLEIKVGNDPALTPRQQLTTVAYAMKADSVRDGSITSASIANGTLTADDFAPGALGWLLNGNALSGSPFLGSTNNTPLELRVNNRRAMRYQYAEDTSVPDFEFRTVNILGGSEANSIAPGVVGATIAGGGQDNFNGNDAPNIINDNFGVIGGGNSNRVSGYASTISGGFNNTTSGFVNTIAGGFSNTTSAADSTIGGGSANTASGQASTVAGGNFNEAIGIRSTVSGGDDNIASGFGSVIPGGELNVAAGDFSFAAGFRAKANHSGAFVWSDASSNADFSSTGPHQFLIRAAGGVGIGTIAPSHALTVQSGINTMRLIGPNTFGSGAKFNFGDADFAFIQEDTDDSLLIHARLNVRVEGTLVNASDGRWKQDVAPLDNPLDTILALRGVSYQWRHDIPGKNFPDGKQIGFIAQEVEKVLPELVATDDKGYKAVSYVNVVPVLVEAIKQQQAQIEALKAENRRVTTLETQIAALAARLTQMEAEKTLRK